MKKTLIGLGAMLLVAGSMGGASALILTDTTLFTATGTDAADDLVGYGRLGVNLLSTSALQALNLDYDYVTWNHLFTFDPAADEILSATLTLSFKDDSGEGDGGFLGWKNEFAFGYAESGNWALGEVNTGNASYDVGISSFSDGSFRVTVASLYGDFYLEKSDLSIDYSSAGTAPVPEPATLLLMGTGLAGLIAARRRKAKKA